MDSSLYSVGGHGDPIVYSWSCNMSPHPQTPHQKALCAVGREEAQCCRHFPLAHTFWASHCTAIIVPRRACYHTHTGRAILETHACGRRFTKTVKEGRHRIAYLRDGKKGCSTRFCQPITTCKVAAERNSQEILHMWGEGCSSAQRNSNIATQPSLDLGEHQLVKEG